MVSVDASNDDEESIAETACEDVSGDVLDVVNAAFVFGFSALAGHHLSTSSRAPAGHQRTLSFMGKATGFILRAFVALRGSP